jgi:small subunit ribosomal protein S19e
MAKEIYAKDAQLYITALAEKLKEIPEFKAPEWAVFVKSGTSRQRPPAKSEFWYIRTASILRQLYIKGVVGVGKLRVKYGARKDRGGMPDEFRKAGGKIIRTILQQAESAGLVEKVSKFQYGRRLTEKGKKVLDSIEVEEKKKLDYDELRIKNVREYEQNIQEDNQDNEENSDAIEETEALNDGK